MSDARLQGWRLARLSSARVRARVGWHNALSGKAVSFRLARSSAPSRSRSRTASRRLSSIATIRAFVNRREILNVGEAMPPKRKDPPDATKNAQRTIARCAHNPHRIIHPTAA